MLGRCVAYKLIETKMWEKCVFTGQTRFLGFKEDNNGYIKLCTRNQVTKNIKKFDTTNFKFSENSLNMPPTLTLLTVLLDPKLLYKKKQYYVMSLNNDGTLSPRLFGNLDLNENIIDLTRIPII